MTEEGGERTLHVPVTLQHRCKVLDCLERATEPAAHALLDEVLGLVHGMEREGLGVERNRQDLTAGDAKPATAKAFLADVADRLGRTYLLANEGLPVVISHGSPVGGKGYRCNGSRSAGLAFVANSDPGRPLPGHGDRTESDETGWKAAARQSSNSIWIQARNAPPGVSCRCQTSTTL